VPRKLLPNVPWITKDGSVDMGKIPIEYNFQSAIGSDREKAFNSIRIISSASCHGRKDASIFLMGLLVGLPPDDWEMRTAVVEALQYTQTEQCVSLLISEIRRIKSSNTTRRYIDEILRVLKRFPEDLVRDEIESLAKDDRFSYKMRQKFKSLFAKPKYSDPLFRDDDFDDWE